MPLASLILDALFPDACLACLAPRDGTFRHEVACDACLRGVRLSGSFSCGACSAVTATLVPECHASAHVTLDLGMERAPEHLASALLFEGIHRAAAPLGELVAASAAAAGMPLHRAYVAPFPETRAILRERGYGANALVSRATADTLDLPHAQHLLAASRVNARTVYGIGEPGDAASANLVMLVAVEAIPRAAALQTSALVRAACPHAVVIFASCAP